MKTRKRSEELQRITWDQAEILRLSTLQGFSKLGMNPGVLRKWSAEGKLHPVAKAPGGAFLFHIPTVIAAKRWHERRQEASE